jgi:hypothetical protein
MHPDPEMDELQRRVSTVVEEAVSKNQDAVRTFYDILRLAYKTRGEDLKESLATFVNPLRLRPPRLTEAWFC